MRKAFVWKAVNVLLNVATAFCHWVVHFRHDRSKDLFPRLLKQTISGRSHLVVMVFLIISSSV